MVKKIGHIILSLVLLVSTMGMAISKHYCKGSLESVAVFQVAKPCCDTDNCCQSETQVYQVKEDFSVPSVSSIPVLAILDVFGRDLFAGALLTTAETEIAGVTFLETPPLLPIQKTLSLKQVYLL